MLVVTIPFILLLLILVCAAGYVFLGRDGSHSSRKSRGRSFLRQHPSYNSNWFANFHFDSSSGSPFNLSFDAPRGTPVSVSDAPRGNPVPDALTGDTRIDNYTPASDAGFATSSAVSKQANKFASLSLADQKKEMLRVSKGYESIGLNLSNELRATEGNKPVRLLGEKEVCTLLLEFSDKLRGDADKTHKQLESTDRKLNMQEIQKLTDAHISENSYYFQMIYSNKLQYPAAAEKYGIIFFNGFYRNGLQSCLYV